VNLALQISEAVGGTGPSVRDKDSVSYRRDVDASAGRRLAQASTYRDRDPGRLIDHMERRNIVLSKFIMLVIDEGGTVCWIWGLPLR
jgi:hypothetical protein